MRHHPAKAEAKLWSALRARKLGGFKFRRQSPMAPYIVDFYCHQLGLIVELDGDSHAETRQYDARRTQRLMRGGSHVLRFLNTDARLHFDAVRTEILRECERLLTFQITLTPALSQRERE